jgi:RNA polymerase sigma-70 factor (ECF subfamily)
VTGSAWIHESLTSARPKVVGALLRYFRDLDAAEDAFQEACLRALKTWPSERPRDAAAWLIFAGRNIGIDEIRRTSRQQELPPDELPTRAGDVEAALVDELDSSHYRDDVLRLLFICCHPDLSAAHQIALALRVVSGLSVKEVARAFLISESAMEQRLTRAKRRVAESGIPFDTPDFDERDRRVATVASMIYLLFNEGYSASGGEAHVRAPLCEEAIRLARLLMSLSEEDPEIMGLTALLLLQHARTPARLDSDGAIILLERQDRNLWNRVTIREGIALVEHALLKKRPGPYQVQAAIAAVHAQALRAEDTDWEEIDQLYASLEALQPSPVVTLNRAVAVSKVRGPRAALEMIEPLSDRLGGYFYYFGLRGALLMQLGRHAEARSVFCRALELAHTPAEAAHIRLQMNDLVQNSQPV